MNMYNIFQRFTFSIKLIDKGKIHPKANIESLKLTIFPVYKFDNRIPVFICLFITV